MRWGWGCYGVLGLAVWAVASWGGTPALADAGQEAVGSCQGVGPPVVLQTIARGGLGQLTEPGAVVIRQEADWQALWGRLSLPFSLTSSVPGVHFSTEMVLAVSAGERRGALEIEITRVEQRQGCLLVTVTERRSPHTLPLGQLLALRPFHLVRLGRWPEPVVFRYMQTMPVKAPWAVVWQALEATVGEHGDTVASADARQGVLTTAPVPLSPARLQETVRVTPESAWEAGRYWLEMRLEQVAEATVRVELGAQMECQGRTPPRSEASIAWWPCSSTGAIEEEVWRVLTQQLAARTPQGH